MITDVKNRREVQDGTASGTVVAQLESALKGAKLYGISEGHLVPPIVQPREIVELGYEAGWHDAKQLWISCAVCLAESQGYAGSYNDNKAQIGVCKIGQYVRNAETGELYLVKLNDGNTVTVVDSRNIEEVLPKEALVVLSRDVGLWEINILAHQIGTQVEHDLYDPVKNSVAAFKLWGTGSGWGRWASHSSGVYLHPYYAARAELGVMNWLAAFGNSLGSTVPVPVWTIAELRAKVVW